jgi:hypothetical protein
MEDLKQYSDGFGGEEPKKKEEPETNTEHFTT